MQLRYTGILGAVLLYASCSEAGAGDGGGDGGSAYDRAHHPTDSTGKTSSSSATQNEFVAGSRLKVRTWIGSDGAKLSLGFFDSQLKVPCAFVLGDDAKSWCMPSGSTMVGAYARRPFQQDQQLFADSSCSRPLYTSDASIYWDGGSRQPQGRAACSTPAYVALGTKWVGSCANLVRESFIAYRVKAFAGPLFQQVPQWCGPSEAKNEGNLFELERIPNSSLVEGHEVVEP
jgi:hypothetical protein